MVALPVHQIQGACPHDCPDTCSMLTTVQDGRAIAIQGDPDHPITGGWLCAKVRPYLERVYHPDRLTQPLRRSGPKGSGKFEPISWDVAIDEITSRWKQIIDEHGAAAILPYSFSGTLGMLQTFVCNERLWNRMGASGLERSICGAAAETVVTLTFGARMAPDPTHLREANLIVIWGHNPASTSPHTVPFIREAQRNGARIIVIDPRRSTTARSADWHIRPQPATDGALALGIMHIIFRDHLHDQQWLEHNSLGWEALRERVLEYPPERVAQITGLDIETLENLAHELATTSPAAVKISDGIQRHENGGQTVRAISCIPAITGQIGKRGGGFFYTTSGYVAFDEEAVGHASECPPVPRIVNMNRIGAALTGEVADPPIMSLFVFCANPVASSPNANLTITGLQREDLFTVVHDLFLTDTARYADIVLPATSQLEQVDLHRPYGHRNLQYNHQAIEPLGESKSNWDVTRLLAAGMGYDDPWLHQESEEVIEEVIEATRRNNPYIANLTLDIIKERGTYPLEFSADNDVPFADGYFPTPSGKFEIYCEAVQELGLDPLPEFIPDYEYRDRPEGMLALISAASHHFVSSSMANVPALMRKEQQAELQIHPEDARERGVIDGELVIVENDRGAFTARASVTEDAAPGLVISPKGQWPSNSIDGRNVNTTTSDRIGDIAGQSTFHSNLVRVRPAT